jgi:DNA-binding CsgD family transcriptional regulator
VYLSTVQQLVRQLMTPEITTSEVCKYLVLNIFTTMKASAVYAGEITKDGFIAPVGSFGLPEKTITSWGNIPLTLKAPLTDAVKQDKIILLQREDTFEKYPALSGYEGIPEAWESYLVCPTLPHGLIALTLDSSPKLSRETEEFIRTISSLVSLHHQKDKLKPRAKGDRESSRTSGKNGALNGRQLLIKDLMEKGFSNPQIASEIGYSESLVRQETMAIFSILDISGRKELLERNKN